MFATLAVLVASTSLHITVWPQGADGPKRAWTLRCAPVGGTLPHRASACKRLSRIEHPFRPVPKDAVCLEIYGGPQTALVAGRLRGTRVRARFDRHDGCEIARWERVRFLFPVTTGVP
jgi:Subtilisin inhibitor-like